MGEQLGLQRDSLRKLCFQDLRNPLVVMLPRAPEERLIGNPLLDEGVLEGIERLGTSTLLIDQLGVHELPQAVLHSDRVEWGDRQDEVAGKLPPNRRAQLRHCLDRTQAIEAGLERVLEGGRNGQGRQGAGQLIAALTLLKQPRLQHHLRQLFDKQGHPIGFRHDLLEHLGREPFPPRHACDEAFRLRSWEAGEGELGSDASGLPRAP